MLNLNRVFKTCCCEHTDAKESEKSIESKPGQADSSPSTKENDENESDEETESVVDDSGNDEEAREVNICDAEVAEAANFFEAQLEKDRLIRAKLANFATFGCPIMSHTSHHDDQKPLIGGKALSAESSDQLTEEEKTLRKVQLDRIFELLKQQQLSKRQAACPMSKDNVSSSDDTISVNSSSGVSGSSSSSGGEDAQASGGIGEYKFSLLKPDGTYEEVADEEELHDDFRSQLKLYGF